MLKKIYLIVLMAVLAACASPTSPLPIATSVSPSPIITPVSPISTPGRELIVGPMQIDKVEVRVAQSAPVQVFAHVTGIVGDGCSQALPVEQQRDGNTITLSIQRQRPADAVCIQLAKIFDEDIRLMGDFPAGDYVLKVNTVTQNFTVD